MEYIREIILRYIGSDNEENKNIYSNEVQQIKYILIDIDDIMELAGGIYILFYGKYKRTKDLTIETCVRIAHKILLQDTYETLYNHFHAEQRDSTDKQD